MPTFEQQMGDLEIDAARTTLGQVQSDTSAARNLTSDPVWGPLAAFPWGGQNLEATGTATATVADVVTDGLDGLVDAGEGLGADLAAIDRRCLLDHVEAALTELESSLDVAEQVGTRFGEQLAAGG